MTKRQVSSAVRIAVRAAALPSTLVALSVLAVSGRAHAIEKASEQVSPFMGSFSRSVRLEVPAFHGIEPGLAFTYTSEGRNGFVGVGWNLSGISTIERVNAGLGTPRWDGTDAYMLDGQQLIPCGAIVSPSCSSGGSFATKDESYLKISYDSVNNTWQVWGRGGTKTTFSPIVQPAAGHTLRWGQTSTIDTKGNSVTTSWTPLDGDAYPETISYNGYSITFIRESRTDTLSFAEGDTLGKTLYRLRGVAEFVGSTPIRAYRLLYSYSPLTGRSLLTSMEQLGKDFTSPGAVALPAQTFTYQNDTLGKGFYPISGDPPSPPGTIEDVVWANLVNTQATGNDLIKSGGSQAWDAGASSTRAIFSGNGYLEVTTSVGGNKMIGLSNGDTDGTQTDIDFALYQNVNDLYAAESGTLYGPLGHPLVNGEALRIEVQDGRVYYKQNGVVVRQAQRRPVYPLLVDASIWSAGQSLIDAVISGSLQNTTHWCGYQLLTGDFNGDGRTDQLCRNGVASTTKVALATASGFDTATLWFSGGYSVFTIADYNNDGKADLGIFDQYSGIFSVALSTGTAFAAPVTWGSANGISYGGQPHSCRIAPPSYPYATVTSGDFNGDGLMDIACRVNGLPEQFVGLSNGTGVTFSIFGQLSCDLGETTGAIDFDGDGKDDWYCIGQTYSNLLVFPSTGSSFLYPAFGSLDNNFCSAANYILGDLNGDGRTDAACTNGRVALSTGRYFDIQAGGGTESWCASGSTFAADVDGDGASELLCNNAAAPTNDIEVRKWKAGALAAAEVWKANWCAATVHAGDFNGDGKTDLICSAFSAPVVAGTGGFRADLLGAAGNGIGGTTQVSYSSSVVFPSTNNPPPKQVVTALTTLDGRGGSSTATYSYSGGLMDRQERRFLGFHEVVQTLPCLPGEETCPSIRTVLKQDLASAGKPESVERKDGSGHTLLRSELTYATTLTPPRTSQVSEEWSYTYDVLGAYRRTRAAHQFDAYGNRTQTIFFGDADVSGDEKTTAWTFQPNLTAYITDRVNSETQFAGEGTTGLKLSERHFAYDEELGWGNPPSQGFLTRIDSWLDTESRWVSRKSHYDTWGNVASSLDETDRPVTFGYDSAYHVFLTSTTNGASESETAVWDPICGVPTERRDANAQPVTFQTDNYCRPTQTNFPLGAFEIRSYPSLGDPAAQQVRVETPSATEGDGSGNDYVLEYFDGLGRPYKAVKKGTAAHPTIRKDTSFNARGSVSSETAPYFDGFETARTTTFTFDSLDRITASTFPGNAQVQRSYGIWRDTVFDEHGHPTTTELDAYGRRVKLEQVLNSQTHSTVYSFDLLGRMTGITDPAGIQWSWTFDSLGRNTARNDPDSGAWTFQYDDAGRLMHQTDAKGQETDFSYDLAGRLSSKVNAAGTVTIGHSEARAGYYNIGRTTSVTSAGQSLTMDYDKEGRPLQQRRMLDGVEYLALRRYDSAGRLRGITYPDGEAIGSDANPLTYDRTGHLYSIPGILSEVLYDAAGRPTLQTAANAAATQTTKTYSDRGLLTDIVTAAGDSTIQNLHYTPDAAGQVESVSSPQPNEGWNYAYDELHHLTSATSVADNAQSQAFQYDAAGRMTHNSRLGTYTYPPNGWGRPHAPDSINGTPYSYDANGNLTGGGGRSIVWNANNQATQITAGANISTMTYDGLGQRVKKTTPATNSTSLYPTGDDYEVTNGGITKYISAPGLGVVAKKVNGNPFWLHTDRLGSIQAVTDGAGNVVQRRTYRPYGDKIADTTGHAESRGYIDQRQDPENGLTYLHARFYDPATGLFASPDPIGPQGGLNEYGYSFGNPINGSDRSGLVGDGDGTNGRRCWYVGTAYSPSGSIGSIDIGHDQPTNVFMCTSVSRGSNPFSEFATSPLAGWMEDWRAQREELRERRRQQQAAQPPNEQPGSAGCQSDGCGEAGEGADQPGDDANQLPTIPEVLHLLDNFVYGTGPRTTMYGPESPMTRQMMNAPGVNLARWMYASNGGGYLRFPAPFGLIGTGGVPGIGSVGPAGELWGYDGLLTSPSLVRQFVGSYVVTIVGGPGGRSDFYVTNSTSFTSLAYQQGGAWDRGGSGRGMPFSTINQVFYWSEGP